MRRLVLRSLLAFGASNCAVGGSVDHASNEYRDGLNGGGAASGSEGGGGWGVAGGAEAFGAGGEVSFKPTPNDSDGDGTNDWVETAAGYDPKDPESSPQKAGAGLFIVPYEKPPQPARITVAVDVSIRLADIVFALDSTGSMGGEIQTLTDNLGTIAADVKKIIPSVAMGVAHYKDFSAGLLSGSAAEFKCGGAFEEPYKRDQRIMTVSTSAGLASIQNKLQTIQAMGGGDTAESGWTALYQIATGVGIPGFASTVFLPTQGSPLPGESFGMLGGMGFRQGAEHFIVWVTDANSHGSGFTSSPACGVAGESSSAEALTALAPLGAKVIGVISPNVAGLLPEARLELRQAALATDAVVAPAAWGTGSDRPAACASGQCCTKKDGSGEAPVGGECPLVFEVGADGGGLGNQVTAAINTLATYRTLDVRAEVVDAPGDDMDAPSQFVERVIPSTTLAPGCLDAPVKDTDGDGEPDTYLSVAPGGLLCFDIIAKENSGVQSQTAAVDYPGIFRATSLGTVVGERAVHFVVPGGVPGANP